MHKEKRHSKIVDLIHQEQTLSISELSQRLNVSSMTIWRDLVDLEQGGLIRRVRGGASWPSSPEDANSTSASAWPNLPGERTELKSNIGMYAAQELVKDGDNIIIEAGTTASSMFPFLHQSNLTVLFNGLWGAFQAVQRAQTMTLICSGGVLIETGAFIGPQAEEFFSKYRTHKAFLGAQGVSLEDGFTDPTPLYSQLKCAMVRSAEQVIVLVDSSKFGIRSLIQILSFQDVDIVVTDAAAPVEILDGLRQKGIDVRIAA